MLQAVIAASKASLEEKHSGVQAGAMHTSMTLDIKISECAMENMRILVNENSDSVPKLDVLKEWSKFSVLDVPQSPAQLTKERMVVDPKLDEERMNKRLEAEEDLLEEARGAIFLSFCPLSPYLLVFLPHDLSLILKDNLFALIFIVLTVSYFNPLSLFLCTNNIQGQSWNPASKQS